MEMRVDDQDGTHDGTTSHNVSLASVPGAVRPDEGSWGASTLRQTQRNIIRQTSRHFTKRRPWNSRATGSWIVKVPDRGHYVYIAWGLRRRRPLYVGVSGRLFDRIGTHLFEAEWGSKVHRFEFWSFATAEEAANAELLAIIELNPVHNVRRTHPSYRGISDEQAEIISRVQNRGRS